jgi:hypothetical protein
MLLLSSLILNCNYCVLVIVRFRRQLDAKNIYSKGVLIMVNIRIVLTAASASGALSQQTDTSLTVLSRINQGPRVHLIN